MNSPRTVVHIGYPKAGSTFLQDYMASHPGLDSSLESMDEMVDEAAGKPDRAPSRDATGERVRLITNEKIAESLVATGDPTAWHRNKFIPGTWDDTARHTRIDPLETARRVRRGYGADLVLIVIRDQTAWLQSAYKYYLPNLPAQRRTFADFCATSIGCVYLEIGHYDRVIEPYFSEFGANNVKVLRAEMLRNSPDLFASAFCEFVGVPYRPIPQGSANVGATNEAAILRARFPIVDRLPPGVRKFGSAVLSRVTSARGSIFSNAEIEGIRVRYADSNRRVERLLQEAHKAAGRG